MIFALAFTFALTTNSNCRTELAHFATQSSEGKDATTRLQGLIDWMLKEQMLSQEELAQLAAGEFSQLKNISQHIKAGELPARRILKSLLEDAETKAEDIRDFARSRIQDEALLNQIKERAALKTRAVIRPIRVPLDELRTELSPIVFDPTPAEGLRYLRGTRFGLELVEMNENGSVKILNPRFIEKENNEISHLKIITDGNETYYAVTHNRLNTKTEKPIGHRFSLYRWNRSLAENPSLLFSIPVGQSFQRMNIWKTGDVFLLELSENYLSAMKEPLTELHFVDSKGVTLEKLNFRQVAEPQLATDGKGFYFLLGKADFYQFSTAPKVEVQKVTNPFLPYQSAVPALLASPLGPIAIVSAKDDLDGKPRIQIVGMGDSKIINKIFSSLPEPAYFSEAAQANSNEVVVSAVIGTQRLQFRLSPHEEIELDYDVPIEPKLNWTTNPQIQNQMRHYANGIAVASIGGNIFTAVGMPSGEVFIFVGADATPAAGFKVYSTDQRIDHLRWVQRKNNLFLMASGQFTGEAVLKIFSSPESP